MAKFTDVFIDATKDATKIPKEKYLPEGLYPIIDQGQSDIAGYTNDIDGLYTDVPAIIFGDHTRIIKYVDEPCFLGADGVKLLKAQSNDTNYKFLYYALSNAKIPNTGYNRHFKWLKEIEIPLYSENEQRNIVSVLDKVTELINKGNAQLSKLEELVKSRFVEMLYNKNFDKVELDKLCIKKGEYGAQSASCVYDKTRPRYIRITDINDDGTLNSDYVSSSNINDDNNYMLEYGDFLFARMGATVGKTYAYKNGNQIFAGYLIKYRLDLNKILPDYLFNYTKTNEYWNWVKINQSGAAQPGINAKKYGSLLVELPPIELQNEFATFAQQIDKLKFEVQNSLEKLETLKKSLMQKYFK